MAATEQVEKAQYGNSWDKIDYTPSSAITAGTPTQIGGLVGVPSSDVAASEKAAFQTQGRFNGKATSAVGNAGDNVYWDADGSPVGGTASSGAFTTLASAGDFWVGTLESAHAATGKTMSILLNQANPNIPAYINRLHETKSDNYTVDVQDSGKVIHVDTDAKTIALPAIATGCDIVIMNDGADGTVAINISPNSSDKIQGMDIAGADNKDLINTKATADRGDYVRLVGNDNADGWLIIEKRGIWATEA